MSREARKPDGAAGSMADHANAGGSAGQGGSKLNGPVPRLMIMKMVLENFKSYGGKKEIGPFHKCFSSVVGPNGSGKSNVIDAMLFVFGKRAQQIRLKNLSELIHKSKLLPNCDKCAVSVHFAEIIDHPNSDDGYDVVPGSRFVITRTADVNNQSKYYINDRASTFTEVTTMLRSKHIDLDNNRFLILQGEVEQIAMMKPKSPQPGGESGLLEYLEDIIGSDKYIEAIDKAGAEAEALQTQRNEQQERLKLVERERDSLEQPRAEAQQYLEYEFDVSVKQAHLNQFRMYRAETDAQDEENLRQAVCFVDDSGLMIDRFCYAC